MSGLLRRVNLLIIIVLSVIMILFFSTSPSTAAIFTPGTADELIEAILAANSNSEADVINLMTSVTYTYAIPAEPAGNSALPPFTSEIVINGNGATIARSTDDNTPEFRILQVLDSGNLTLNNVTITNGGNPADFSPEDSSSEGLNQALYSRTTSWSPEHAGAGITNAGTLVVNDCTVKGNTAESFGGGILNFGILEINRSCIKQNLALFGGGLANINGGSLKCNDTEISGNMGLSGCGLLNDAVAVFNNCIIDGNRFPLESMRVRDGRSLSSISCGGGVVNLAFDSTAAGLLELNDCTIKNNLGFLGGGVINGLVVDDALLPGGMITVKRCTISANRALWGGGLLNLMGNVNVANCTVSDNSLLEELAPSPVGSLLGDRLPSGVRSGSLMAIGGGCLNFAGQLEIVSSTITGNQAAAGGGIFNVGESAEPADSRKASESTAVVLIKNTIVAGNSAGEGEGADCAGLFDSYGFNLIGTIPGDPAVYSFNEFDNSGTDNLGSDPLLGPLQDNGGKTFTCALLLNSPAINSGDCTDVEGNIITADQRGEPRPFLDQGVCDVGAYEYPSSDGTGVASEVQNDGPNDGDGNGDGIIDSRQRTVASLPAADGGGYITVEITGCNQIRKVKTYSYSSFENFDSEYKYPFGLVGFEINCSSAKVRIYYHGAEGIESLVYRKFGPTPDDWGTLFWYDMTGVVFGGKEIGGKTVPYVEFFLSEGQLGDDTAEPPIVDVGGLGQQTSIPTLNEWGIIIMGLLLAGISLITISRQRGRMEL